MADYAKWDKLEVSDDEDESKKRQRELCTRKPEELRGQAEMLGDVSRWLRKQIKDVDTGIIDEQRRLSSDGSRPATVLPRFVTEEERSTLAMFLVVTHFEEDSTNIMRHRQIVDLARRNLWLEDAGTLELLCRVHRGAGHLWDTEDYKMRQMLFSAINTLVAPKCPECKGNILDLFSLIAAPADAKARALRERYQKKEFARDFVSDPRYGKNAGMGPEQMLNIVFYCFLGFLVLLMMGKVAYRYYYYGTVYGGPPTPSNATMWESIFGVSAPAPVRHIPKVHDEN